MKINKKALELVELGLTSKTVEKLTESQINELHSRLFKEQSAPIVRSKTVKQIELPSGSETTVGNVSVSNKGGKTTITPTSEEMSEEKDDTKKNPWAICHKKLGPRKNAKFESCVKQVKKSLEEGKNDLTLSIENKIMKIVESHLPPKITKQDLVKYLSEAEPATAPVKEPKTKPGTKTPPVKKPAHPGKNPNPKINPAPKAKNVDPEEAKEKIIDTIMKMLEK